MVKRTLVAGCALVFIAFISHQGYGPMVSTTENSESNMTVLSIPQLGLPEICNPEIAIKYGIYGYLSLDVAQDTPKQLHVRGGDASVTLLLKFVSHKEDLTEAEVTIDPTGEWGLKIEVTYGNRCLCLKDLVHYDPSGKVKIEAGQTLLVKMNFKVPEYYPHAYFPVGGVGITADYPIIDSIYDVNCCT